MSGPLCIMYSFVHCREAEGSFHMRTACFSSLHSPSNQISLSEELSLSGATCTEKNDAERGKI